MLIESEFPVTLGSVLVLSTLGCPLDCRYQEGINLCCSLGVGSSESSV